MANLAALLKSEISRLAKREIRVATEKLAKASSAYRSDIAALKRRVLELERELAASSKALKRLTPSATIPAAADGKQHRFSAERFAQLRTRLDLSAAAMGKLLGGLSGQTVRNYEDRTSRPSKETIARIAALRKMGKREVQALLAAQ